MPGIVDASVRERVEDVILRTRPVLYVPMSGTKMRELVRGQFLTVTGAVLAPGPFQGSYGVLFDGVNDRMTLTTDASYQPGDTFTVGGWFKLTGAGADTGGIVLTCQANGYTVYRIAASSKMALRKSGVGDVFSTTQTFSTSTPWTRITFAKNAGTGVTCWVNGVAVAGSFSNQTIANSGADITFGEGSTSTNDFSGSLAHWAVWNRVLTEDEERTIYLAGVNAT